MSNRKKIIPTLKELRADLKGMTFKEKLDHLWTYYKEYLALAAVLVVLIVATVSAALSASRNIVCSGVMANGSITSEGMLFLTDDFAAELGIDQKRDVVEVNYTNFESLVDPTNMENNYNTAMLLINMVAGGRMDYAIVDEIALDFYITQDVFLDLREFFTEEQLQELAEQDRLVYYQYQQVDSDGIVVWEEERYPVAVKMQDMAFTKAHMYNDPYFFCVSGNEPDMEMTMRMWQRIVNYGN